MERWPNVMSCLFVNDNKPINAVSSSYQLALHWSIPTLYRVSMTHGYSNGKLLTVDAFAADKIEQH